MPHRSYRTVVADPPWLYYDVEGPRISAERRPQSWAGPTGGAGSAARYGSMALDDIAAMPVRQVAAREAHLYLWTTNSFICEAHDIARAWGFTPKTLITWGKIKADGSPSMKTGYWFRSATEHCLFAVRGSLRLLDAAIAPTLFLHPRLPHSVKPDEFMEMVEAVSPGPYLELFARRARPGWDVWGDQAPGAIRLP